MKTRKAIGRQSHKNMQQKCAIDEIVSNLDLLAAQAEGMEMDAVARVLYTAREELVYLAVHEHCHQSDEDRFINRRLHGNRLLAVGEFIECMRGIEDPATRSEIFGLFRWRSHAGK